jgi:hypothetical protein
MLNCMELKFHIGKQLICELSQVKFGELSSACTSQIELLYYTTTTKGYFTLRR